MTETDHPASRHETCAPRKATLRGTLERDLRSVLSRSELCLFFQPIVDLETGGAVGAEALVRWQHPERGLIGPSDFIPLAEETGLIVLLGRWVLDSACAEAASWAEQGLPSIRVMVNVSARQLLSDDFAATVRCVLDRTRLDPDRLELELTESVAIQNLELAVETMNRVKKMGVRLAIDDFGTGYAALGHLTTLPIDTLKLDRSFISSVALGERERRLVDFIVALGYGLGFDVIAEGIETDENRRDVAAAGCDWGQGYLFARPAPAEEFRRTLAELAPRTVAPVPARRPRPRAAAAAWRTMTTIHGERMEPNRKTRPIGTGEILRLARREGGCGCGG